VKRRRRFGPRAAFCAVALLAALLAGCTSKPPAISRVLGRLIFVSDLKTGEKSETLGVFLVATDPDGLENLDAFYVIDDAAQLFWKVDNTQWATTVAEGETWIGMSTLVMPTATPFPSGSYRVVLESKGGDMVEESIIVPTRTKTPGTVSYPSATVAAETIRVAGASGSCEIWVYGSDGAFAGAFPLQGKTLSLPIATVTGSSPGLAGGFTFRVFTWDPQAGYGLLAGPWKAGA
jgi:hypothetical protein